jgi:hypothetical protein
VRLFNGDHNPPHVHIWTPASDMQVSLATLVPMRGLVGKQEYEVAMDWVRSNIDFLRSEWERLNG